MITFEELGVVPEICNALNDLGFESPMPVQEKVIPLLLDKDIDIIALAQTGTGKTAAFGIPLIQHIDRTSKHTQVLVLCPTRELCVQISGDLNDFAKYIEEIRIIPVYGGASIENQIQLLKKGVQIIVATPGRLIDLMQRKALKLDHVSKIVLDESDEMLKMGFTESINTILLGVPEQHSTLLFSATMPSGVAAITKNYMTNPIEITIGSKNAGAENIKHLCYTVHAKDKYLALKRIADYNPNIYGIIFCRTRRETQEVADKLIQDGYNADSLHGDLSQAQRDLVMQKFRIKNISLLVATDVAARGLDVDNLTHVINYNLPDDIEAYTHRSGRTGRAGKSGISIAIINLREKHIVRQIEKIIKKSFIHTPVPGGREICEKQLFSMIDKMEKVELDHTEIDTYLPVIYRKLEWLDKEELIKRFVSLEFNRFIDYYKNAQDINISEDSSRERGNPRERNAEPRRSSGTEAGYTRLFINIGKLDDLWPKNLIELINQNTKGAQIPVGKIDILQKFSFFEVESKFSNEVMRALKGVPYGNITISVEAAQGKDSKPERGGYGGGGNRDGFKRRSDSSEGGYKKPSTSGGDRDRGGRDGFKRKESSGGGESWGAKRGSDAGFSDKPKRAKKKY